VHTLCVDLLIASSVSFADQVQNYDKQVHGVASLATQSLEDQWGVRDHGTLTVGMDRLIKGQDQIFRAIYMRSGPIPLDHCCNQTAKTST
jgi:hypothetical protein